MTAGFVVKGLRESAKAARASAALFGNISKKTKPKRKKSPKPVDVLGSRKRTYKPRKKRDN